MTTKKPEGPMAELARIKRKAGNVLLGELEKAELAEFEADSDRRADCLHPSEMAKEDWCYRASYYRIKHNQWVKDEKFSPQMQRIFATGNEAHTKWQRRMRATGKLWGDWRCIVCRTVRGECFEPPWELCHRLDEDEDPRPHIWEYREVSLAWGIVSGHEDGGIGSVDPAAPDHMVLDGNSYLVELKTIGTGTVRHDAPDLLKEHYKELKDGGRVYDIDSLWRTITKPFPTHTRQANVYLWLAGEMGLPFKKVRFLYELKHNSSTKEFVIVPSERIMKPILTGMRVVEYALEQGVPPECNQKDENGENCRQCTAYEEELFGAKQEDKAAGGGEPSATSGDGSGGTPPRRRVTRRRGKAPGEGDRPGHLGTAADGDAPRDPRGRDVPPGQRADEPVPVSEQVDAVPDGTGVGRSRGRIVRRKGRSEG